MCLSGISYDKVQPLAGAKYAVFHCADIDDEGISYYESMAVQDLYHPQTILAYELNGKPLDIPHGAPLRLRFERQLGYKHAKYVTRIELVESLTGIGGGKGGYWEDQGYEWYAGIQPDLSMNASAAIANSRLRQTCIQPLGDVQVGGARRSLGQRPAMGKEPVSAGSGRAGKNDHASPSGHCRLTDSPASATGSRHWALTDSRPFTTLTCIILHVVNLIILRVADLAVRLRNFATNRHK